MIAFICSLADSPSDKEFITWLYTEFGRLMIVTVNQYTASPQEAEDIMQDCFMRLIGRVAVLRTMTRRVLVAYLLASVRNVSLNHIRKNNIERKYRVDVADPELADSERLTSIEDIVLQREKGTQLVAIWSQLAEEDRFLLEGKYILGMEDADLAKQLGCKTGSIRMKMTRARRRLSALLDAQEVR